MRQGRQRVGTITGPQDMIAGIDRYQGYCQALQAMQRPLRAELVVEGDFSEESGYRGMKKLLPHKPDAVFVATDTMAMGALRALREEGVRVPQEIALVGYDDMPAASRFDPPLTTMNQATVRLGATAVEILLEVIQDPDSPRRHQLLQPELVVRSSCGAISG